MRERAHQYRVMAERQQFHLDRQNLPTGAAHLVREERDRTNEAAHVVIAAAINAAKRMAPRLLIRLLVPRDIFASSRRPMSRIRWLKAKKSCEVAVSSPYAPR